MAKTSKINPGKSKQEMINSIEKAENTRSNPTKKAVDLRKEAFLNAVKFYNNAIKSPS